MQAFFCCFHGPLLLEFVLVSIGFRHIKIQRLGIFTFLGHIWGNACRLGIKSAVCFSTEKKKERLLSVFHLVIMEFSNFVKVARNG